MYIILKPTSVNMLFKSLNDLTCTTRVLKYANEPTQKYIFSRFTKLKYYSRIKYCLRTNHIIIIVVKTIP